MSTVANRINRVVSDFYSDDLGSIAEQVAKIEPSGYHRRFVVCRMGSTGSSWLAKLLNSHSDVLCTHEGVVSRVFPRTSFDSNDIVELIRQLAGDDGTHGAYEAVGDVGSVGAAHTLGLRGKFTTALLIRHPARILNTRLHIYPADQSFSAIPPSSRSLIQELWDIDISELPGLDRMFLHDLLIFASQVLLLDNSDMILRIEDLQDLGYCQQVLSNLTSVRYDISLVARAVCQPINTRTGAVKTIPEIVAGFTPAQRHWYFTVLGHVAPLFGYDLEQDVCGCDADQGGVSLGTKSKGSSQQNTRAFHEEIRQI